LRKRAAHHLRKGGKIKPDRTSDGGERAGEARKTKIGKGKGIEFLQIRMEHRSNIVEKGGVKIDEIAGGKGRAPERKRKYAKRVG